MDPLLSIFEHCYWLTMVTWTICTNHTDRIYLWFWKGHENNFDQSLSQNVFMISMRSNIKIQPLPVLEKRRHWASQGSPMSFFQVYKTAASSSWCIKIRRTQQNEKNPLIGIKYHRKKFPCFSCWKKKKLGYLKWGTRTPFKLNRPDLNLRSLTRRPGKKKTPLARFHPRWGKWLDFKERHFDWLRKGP